MRTDADMSELEDRLRSTLHKWAAEAPVPARRPPPARTRRPQRPWWLIAAPIAVAASVLAAVLLVDRDERAGQVVVTGRPDVVLREVAVGERLGVRVLVSDGEAIFVASENDRRVYRVDTADGTVVEGPALAVPDRVAFGEGAVFAIVDGPPRLARLDPTTLTVETDVDVAEEPLGLFIVDGAVWIPLRAGGVLRFDARTLEAMPALAVDLDPGFAKRGGAGLWRVSLDRDVVERLDPATGAVEASVAVDGDPYAVAVADDVVWVTDVEHDLVLRIDPDQARVVATIAVGHVPRGLALTDDRLWVTNFEDGTLSAIDTTSNEVLSTVPVGVRPGGIVVMPGSLWIAMHQEGVVRNVATAALEQASLRPIDELTTSIELDGRTIFVRCMGATRDDRPTVILEAGGYAWSEHWLFVQYGLQTTHRVCAYDRAGLGRSEQGPEPRIASRIVDDLHRALAAANIGGPYVLVGHGYGGLYAQLFAATFPQEVDGLVLVDAMTPTFIESVRPLLTAAQRAEIDESFASDPQFTGAVRSFDEVRAAGSLGNLPLAVIARDPAASQLAPPVEALWQDHQRMLAELSSRATFSVATGVGNEIPFDAPGDVVAAIRDLG